MVDKMDSKVVPVQIGEDKKGNPIFVYKVRLPNGKLATKEFSSERDAYAYIDDIVEDWDDDSKPSSGSTPGL